MVLHPSLLRYHKNSLLLLILSLILYGLFAYNLERTEATKLLLLFFGLFVTAYYLKKSGGFNFVLLAFSAIILRLIFLPAIPNLSQDFYRFIWDGRMLWEGFNPYLFTPESFMDQGILPVHQAQELYDGMGKLSASHFTNYPPINQLSFYLAALFSNQSILGSIIVLRLIIISADIGILYFGKKLLEHLRLPSSRIWLYVLNPFIIIELTGNLHFEGVMLFFLIWSIYVLQKGHWKWSAILFAFSVSVKLIPIMFLPLFFWFFIKREGSFFTNSKKLILYYLIVIATILLLFVPFFSKEFIINYSETVGLWFNNFEFNGSIYYLLREIGYTITGYNQIGIIGKILPLISIVIILYFSFFKKNKTITELITSMLLVFTCYLFLSTTVHPWYLATLVLLCLFTNYKYPIVWSIAIILSYLSYLNIGTAAKSENLWIIFIEYVIVFFAFGYETFFKKKITI